MPRVTRTRQSRVILPSTDNVEASTPAQQILASLAILRKLEPWILPKGNPMTFRSLDLHNMNRFRLVDDELSGTTTDSWGIELVIRALAGSRVPVLPTPDGMRVDHSQYLAYWHGLHFLTVARLGWRDPGLGMRAWYDLGKPSIDPTLDFISAVWDRDGSLDAYVLWATRYYGDHASGTADPPALTPEWQRRSHEIRERDELALLDGGSNPPHFGTAEDETREIRDDGKLSRLIITDEQRRRAIFITGDRGFYEDLQMRWGELPEVAPNNWHVEVFNRRLGYIGEYRRSRKTGRLYVGKHSVHMLGN